MLSQSTLQKRFQKYCKRLNAPKNLAVYRTSPGTLGETHVEIDSRNYYYVVNERAEIERRSTADPDELLYWLVSDVTESMAFDYELANRVENLDCRRIAFAKEIELLQSVKAEWAERKGVEQAETLHDYPFDDFSYTRVILTQKLKKEGHSSEDAWKVAYELYRLPDGVAE